MSAISSRTFAISSFCIEGQSGLAIDYTERRDSRGKLLTATPGELATRANGPAQSLWAKLLRGAQPSEAWQLQLSAIS
jgi:hypothetical protein